MTEVQHNIRNFTGGYDELTQIVSSAVGLVVLEFTAPWCPPCRRLDEFLPSLSNESPKTIFLRVNTDEAHEITKHYNISSIPHLKFLKSAQGNQIQELSSITGADLQQIRAKVQQLGN